MRLTPARVLARITVVPVVVVGAWLLVAFPLLLAGQFTPVTGLVIGAPVVLAAVALVPRWVPDLDEDDGVPWWPVAAVLLITVAFAAVQIAFHSEQIVIRRDPASYAQFAAWIAQYGSLPIPQDRALIAGDDPALTYGSAAFYQVGDVIWPQFLAGMPLVMSVGYWVGDITGMLLTAPLLGALGVLSFAGLAARLVGARWAPLAALLLAVCLPEQWVSRSTYSEPAAQVLFLGALVLAFDALARAVPATGRWDTRHLLALAAGLAFGLGILVRIDALRDVLPVVAFLALLLLARRGQALPMTLGVAVGAAYGLTAGFVLSQPYLEHLADSLVPLLKISAVGILALAVATALLWRWGPPKVQRVPWLGTATGILAVVVMAGFALRPLIHTARGHGDEATGFYIGQVQEIEGLPQDPDRTYDEISLYWVGWYVGAAALVLATLGVALLLRRALRGNAPQWVLPLLVLTWTVAATLARPAITPDQPWASRRLIVLVIPAFILFAVWFLAWASHRLREHGAPGGRFWADACAVGGAAVLLLPTAYTATGAMYRMDVGSVAATKELCARIPADGSVVFVDGANAFKFMPLVRNMCGVPTASIDQPDDESVERVVGEIERRGRQAVLAGSQREQLTPYSAGAVPVHPFNVHTEQDPSTLMEPPRGAWRFNGDVWIVAVPRT
ncbi:4-amino-4-deoxy-L-arabinose transferase-like glycosyltransferase [Murinocardiopsis flavida]|uniref:4-amino-4-deoxy-L-arabinose transferase-like glycosyltransferase n=1 Tax=Murinocardiopsis flavida TaxID=645275 RepID=A0A2P8DIM3_9ACTN|nr:hypothetical protein [Murinocardiopsis flavida]PSK97077.1 4-amino-4-deoxy-L-arabinose transferase-like glycosyltransferase [Murinocardiopsis flavida]